MKFFGTVTIFVCLALAAGVIIVRTASAQMVQGSLQSNARFNCAYRYMMQTRQAGDPRWKRIARRGFPSYLTRDSVSLIQSANRRCAARWQ
jgi:hypothetical protein